MLKAESVPKHDVGVGNFFVVREISWQSGRSGVLVGSIAGCIKFVGIEGRDPQTVLNELGALIILFLQKRLTVSVSFEDVTGVITAGVSFVRVENAPNIAVIDRAVAFAVHDVFVHHPNAFARAFTGRIA